VLYVALTRRCWEQFCVLRLSLVPGTSHPSGMAGTESCQQQCLVLHHRRLLERAVTLLPAGVEGFTGDRGFSNQALMVCEAATGWHYHLRLKGTCWFCWRQWRQPSRSIWRRDKQSCSIPLIQARPKLRVSIWRLPVTPFQATFGGRQFSPHNSANALGLWLALRY